MESCFIIKKLLYTSASSLWLIKFHATVRHKAETNMPLKDRDVFYGIAKYCKGKRALSDC